jgi:hypothetical protein
MQVSQEYTWYLVTGHMQSVDKIVGACEMMLGKRKASKSIVGITQRQQGGIE